MLEELEHAKARNARIYAEITGYGSTCDAYHITAPDPDGSGPAKAMLQAVRKAGWKPEDVDLINAHGTSTSLNDRMEAAAIRNAFGDLADSILINSTKSMIGHTLGAAGALETVAAIQSICEGVVHPTANYVTPDPRCPIKVVPDGKALKKNVERLLVNNFGFGGHNGVIAIEKFRK